MDIITVCLKEKKNNLTIKGKKYARFLTEEGYLLLLETNYPFPLRTYLQGEVENIAFLSEEPDFTNWSKEQKAQYNMRHILHRVIPRSLSEEKQKEYDLFLSLKELTGSEANALYFLSTYPNEVLLEEKQKENPYWFYTYYHSLEGDNFRSINQNTIVSTFALRLEQLKAGITYLLLNNEKQGHTWVHFSSLYQRLCYCLERDGHEIPSMELVRAVLNEEERFYVHSSIVALYSAYETEKKIRENVNLLCVSKDYTSLTPVLSEQLCEEQKSAVHGIVEAGGISILTGGPGTGKTTTIASILEYYEDREIALLAPTARAAQRMRESLIDSGFMSEERLSKMHISTIHKFIGYGLPKFLQSQAVREAKLCTLCIVDESSMVDIYRFGELLQILDLCHCKLILVGDANQLPSIQAGNILTDLIQIGVPTFYLRENHRSIQSIYDNAKAILEGRRELIKDEHFIFFPETELENILDVTDFSGLDTVFLTPYRKSYDSKGRKVKGSSTDINTLVHDRLFHTKGITVGDKIMCTRNNYTRDYFNGEVGFVSALTEEGIVVSIGDLDVVIPDREDLDYAYASTIHKSQGSEYSNVYIYLPENVTAEILNKELLYTAITRAKQKVVIIGSEENIYRIMNISAKERRTFLSLQEGNGIG